MAFTPKVKVRAPLAHCILLPSGRKTLTIWNKKKQKTYYIPTFPSAGLQERVVADWVDYFPKIKKYISGFFQLDIQGLISSVPGMHQKVKPACHCYDGDKPTEHQIDLMEHIMHLNDNHNGEGDTDLWPTNRIADWLETLDNQPVLGVK